MAIMMMMMPQQENGCCKSGNRTHGTSLRCYLGVFLLAITKSEQHFPLFFTSYWLVAFLWRL